jgi:hypothetical protein
MTVQGEFKMQAHRISSVVVDIATYKVSHSVDTDAAALRAARARSSSIHRGNGGTVWEGSKASSKSKRRVMDEMPQRVQKGKHSAPQM